MNIKTFAPVLFNKWSPEMAYALGYFAADGSMYRSRRGAHYVSFYSTDHEILQKIKNVMRFDQRIGERKLRKGVRKPCYVLQIGSRAMFQNLRNLGMTPSKSKSLMFPEIPKPYLSHFVRGYFDGDGNVTLSTYRRPNRPSNGRTMLSGFTSGSKLFLDGLREVLSCYGDLGRGTLYFANRAYRLYYSVNDSRKLYQYIYSDAGNLYLTRKKDIFERY